MQAGWCHPLRLRHRVYGSLDSGQGGIQLPDLEESQPEDRLVEPAPLRCADAGFVDG